MTEFGKTMRKFKPLKRSSKERYNNDTKVSQWLENKTEGLHRQLKLNKQKLIKDTMLKGAQLDELKESGLVKIQLT